MAEFEDEPIDDVIRDDTPVGTRVVCIDEGLGTHVKKGKIYTIAKLKRTDLGVLQSSFKELDPTWFFAAKRFKII